MTSYFFYYYTGDTGRVPYFEVVNCMDDAQAADRCTQLLDTREAERAEVWDSDRLVCQTARPRLENAQAADVQAA